MHLAAEPDAGDLVDAQRRQRLLRRAPPVLRVLLGPARPRRGERVRRPRAREDAPSSRATASALTAVVPTSRPISARIGERLFRLPAQFAIRSRHDPATTPSRPGREHRFTFGLWTVGNPGRDPFGGPTRAPVDPVDSVRKLAELGAWGVSLHDDDLVPYGSSAAERDRIVARFKAALDETGTGRRMATTNLFTQPAFKDGAFTSNDRGVRRAAIGKAMRSIDLGAELGAEVYVFWGGREGAETGVAKDPRDALERYREAINVLAEYAVEQGYDLRFAIEPKPNEPRGDVFLPTVGHALHFISTLDRPEMVGVNPEVAHETMAGLSFLHAVGAGAVGGQAVPHRPQRAARSAATTRTSASAREDLKEAFLLVRLLERAGYTRPAALRRARVPQRGRRGRVGLRARLHAHVLALAERARHFDSLPEVRGGARGRLGARAGRADDRRASGEADALKAEAEAGSTRSPAAATANEALDQLVVEVLMGVR